MTQARRTYLGMTYALWVEHGELADLEALELAEAIPELLTELACKHEAEGKLAAIREAIGEIGGTISRGRIRRILDGNTS